ncbi:MAG: hypothetical protein WCF30_05260 [Terracidiphilus sp.]
MYRVPAGVVADYLIWGRYPFARQHAEALLPKTMSILAGSANTSLAKQTAGGEAPEAKAAEQASR